MKGVSFIESLLVIAGIIVLFAFVFPISLEFYKSQQLQVHTQGMVQTLRRAQLKAMAGEFASTFGVYITDDSYTLFQGDSFAARDPQHDEVFDLPQIITVQGTPIEIIFSKINGIPSRTGNIQLSSKSLGQTININGVGRINLE